LGANPGVYPAPRRYRLRTYCLGYQAVDGSCTSHVEREMKSNQQKHKKKKKKKKKMTKMMKKMMKMLKKMMKMMTKVTGRRTRALKKIAD
jgi:hypothetical protein